MSKKQIVLMDQELLEQIDNGRGDLDRDDFLCFCIESVFGAQDGEEPERKVSAPAAPRARVKHVAEPTSSNGEYATREEFLEFKQGITNLMRTFLDFFITFGMELGPAKSATDVEKIKSQLRNVIEGK